MNNKLEVIGIDHGWSMMKTITQVFVTGVKSIVDKAKEKGRSALYRLSEFLGIKKRLLDIRENVRGAIKTTDKDIAKTELLAKGFREAGQTVTNAFRTFADKPEVDYSQKEQKHPITKAVLAVMRSAIPRRETIMLTARTIPLAGLTGGDCEEMPACLPL